MTKTKVLVYLCAFLVIAGGVFPSTASRPARAEQELITGQVIDAGSRHALAGICVVFYDTGSVPPSAAGAVLSGIDGTFSFQGTAGHAYDLAFFEPSTPGNCSSSPNTAVAAEWYAGVAMSLPLAPPAAATRVAAGTRTLDVCLGGLGRPSGCVSAASDGTITGTVLTTGGAPEPGACIVAFALGTPGPVRGAIADAQGNYTLESLPGSTDLTVGFAPPFTGPGGPCDLSKKPPTPPPGALQPVWSGNVFFNLDDPAIKADPYAASLAQGAQIVHAGDVVDACLTNAPGAQIPRPACVAAATPAAVSPRFTG